MPFRTIKEAVALANNGPYGCAASLWSENLTVGMEAARGIKAHTVWINCIHIYDPVAGFGGSTQSCSALLGKEVPLIINAFRLSRSIVPLLYFAGRL